MSDPRLLAAWRDFRSGLRRSVAGIEEIQLARLQALVAYAHENVPYYRALFDSVGFRPAHLRRLSDAAVIPVTTRAQLQSLPPSEIVARGYDVKRLRGARTGGSTGIPLIAYRSRLESYIWRFSRMRTWRYHGIRWTDKVLTISGRATTIRRHRWIRSMPLPWRWNLGAFDGPEVMSDTLRVLDPSVLYGNSVHVVHLAQLAAESRISRRRLRLVATSGDLLPPRYREIIREVWGLDPIDIYNCSEFGDIGWQCRLRDGFHLNADQLFIEFLRDGRPASDGESGEVVGTHLYRYSMPLIRYSPGDLGTPGESRCACGLALPVMRSLEGRTLSIVPLPNGGWSVGFNRMMSEVPEIAKYQVVQRALDQFEISVVPAANFSPEVLTRIADTVRARLGSELRVDVRQVDEGQFIRTASGKVPPVIPFRTPTRGEGESVPHPE